MNIALTFKNFEPSEHLRRYAERRFAKLGRFMHKTENLELAAVLAVDKFRHKADVQLSGDGVSIAAMEQSADMYATVDMVLDKLEVQLKKHAERMKEKRRTGKAVAGSGEGVLFDGKDAVSPLVIVEENVEPKPMFAEEAALQLEQRDEVVLIFLNAETERVNVIYRNKQGGFCLIDPNA